jgi:enoyl-CoA hydratase
MLTGDMIGAEEAYRIGLVNEIVPAAQLIPRAEAILQEIAANAPLAVRYAIQAVNSENESDGIVLEASYFGLLAGTEDKKEGTAAFIEKRAPHFLGR